MNQNKKVQNHFERLSEFNCIKNSMDYNFPSLLQETEIGNILNKKAQCARIEFSRN